MFLSPCNREVLLVLIVLLVLALAITAVSCELGNMESREEVSITTFNILAPQYFRSAQKGVSEAHLDSAVWEKRNAVIAQYLVELDSDIV